MHVWPSMDDRKLIDSLIARADEDAKNFRAKYPGETPAERWIENSFTAALPLAKDASGIDAQTEREPELFSVYRRAIAARLGERVAPRDATDELLQQPTPGEN